LSCPDIGAHEIVLPGADPALPVEAWRECRPRFLPVTASGVGSGAPDATLVASSFALMKASGAFAANPSTAYVFAVAALAYEALGGVRVGSAGGYVPIPGLSESGNAALRRALNPSQGFASARVFLHELASDAGMSKSPAAPAVPSAPTRDPLPVPPALSATKPPRPPRSPVLAIALVAALLAAVGVAVIAVGMRRKPPEAAPVQVAASAPPPAVPASPEPEPSPAPTPLDPQVQAYQDALAAASALEKQDQVGPALSAYAAVAGRFPQEKDPHVAMEKLTAALRARARKLAPSELVALRQPLEEAAALDVMSAQMLLGEMLQRSDPGDSLKWFMAAGNHHRQTEAMVQTGLMLSNGLGIAAPDPAGAVEWFKKAVDNGSTDGMVALAECYMGLIPGTPIDRKRAIELLASASAFHNIRALNMLGDIYRRGEPGLIDPPDPKKALELHTQAMDLGSPDAYGYLGVLYFTGQGMDRPDKKTGCEMMRQGAEKGSSMSMAFYAQCLQDGDGVEKDPAAAREWYIKAAQGGNRAAIAWCKKNNIPLANAP
ncbi:MAG TPA: tetratricopeptide repeat protein, partial [Terrimicrobiaceae bacterium]|nr:tetratricopeptide repeat protein [Terrimicrobiaceae bacterium]